MSHVPVVLINPHGFADAAVDCVFDIYKYTEASRRCFLFSAKCASVHHKMCVCGLGLQSGRASHLCVLSGFCVRILMARHINLDSHSPERVVVGVQTINH